MTNLGDGGRGPGPLVQLDPLEGSFPLKVLHTGREVGLRLRLQDNTEVGLSSQRTRIVTRASRQTCSILSLKNIVQI